MRLALFLCALPLFGASTVIDCGSATDQYFIGGDSWLIPVGLLAPGSTDATLRFGAAFGYNTPAENIAYVVTLRFVEPGSYLPPAYALEPTLPGKRIFSVWINNQMVLHRLDLASEAGNWKPITRSVVAVGADGLLRIKFAAEPGSRGAVVSSIEIAPLVMSQGFTISDDGRTARYRDISIRAVNVAAAGALEVRMYGDVPNFNIVPELRYQDLHFAGWGFGVCCLDPPGAWTRTPMRYDDPPISRVRLEGGKWWASIR